MKRIIFFTIAVLLTISTLALADDSITIETCANGAGTVIIGARTGRKYCMSNAKVNWWNAHSWCDGMGRRLFSLDDCMRDEAKDVPEICGELAVGQTLFVWSATPRGSSAAYYINLANGVNTQGYPARGGTPGLFPALCY